MDGGASGDQSDWKIVAWLDGQCAQQSESQCRIGDLLGTDQLAGLVVTLRRRVDCRVACWVCLAAGRGRGSVQDRVGGIQQSLGDAGLEALDDLSGTEVERGKDVGEGSGLDVFDEGDVCGSSRVVFNPDHDLRAGEVPVEVDHPESLLMTAADMSGGDPARIIPAAGLPLGQGQRQITSSLVQMVVPGQPQMSDGRRHRLVDLEVLVHLVFLPLPPY